MTSLFSKAASGSDLRFGNKTFMNGSLDDIQDWLELAEQASWCVALLAAHCGVSVRTLELYFHGAMGECPRQWLFEQCMRRAADLLRARKSVTETALALGYKYDNRGNFSRDFKRLWGCSPVIYQKRVSACLKNRRSRREEAHSA